MEVVKVVMVPMAVITEEEFPKVTLAFMAVL